jgi:radical SAM superfamily enzyme YgiQ (UPF0313 family)
MYNSKKVLSLRAKRSCLFRAIALAVVCLFLVNDIAWATDVIARPAKLSSSLRGSEATEARLPRRLSPAVGQAVSTLAPQLRLKPFSANHGLTFDNVYKAALIARKMRDDAVDGKIRESHIIGFNGEFKRGEVFIHPKIDRGTLPSGIKYAVAHFEFSETTGKQKVPILLIKDYATLKPGDLEELNKFKVRNAADINYLSLPKLEGVWFVNPQTDIQKKVSALPVEPKIAVVSMPFKGFESKAVFPTGTLYVASALAHHFGKKNVHLINCHADNLSPEQVAQRVKGVDIIALSVNPFAYSYTEDLVKLLHSAYPQKLIVIGGALPSTIPDTFLNQMPGVDIVFVGEAELTIAELADVIKKKRSLSKISRGISIRNAKGDVTTFDMNTPDLLSDVPDLENEYVAPFLKADDGSFTVSFLRGCGYGCMLCGYVGPQKKIRSFGEENFRRQLDQAVRLKAKFVSVNENQFFAGPAEWLELKIKTLEEYHKKHNITWNLVTSPFPEILTPAMLERLYSGGLRQIDLNITSINQEVAGHNNLFNGDTKNISLQQHGALIRTIKSSGLRVTVLLNLGLPGESSQSLRDAVSFLSDAEVRCYNPRTRWYPGSHWFRWKLKHDPEFDPLVYLRTGFSEFLNRPSGVRPLTEARVREETEYALCDPLLKRRLALAIRYAQELSASIRPNGGAATYNASASALTQQTRQLLGDERKLISFQEPLVIKSGKEKHSDTIRALPVSYHYLMEHSLEYEEAGKDNAQALESAVSAVARDYLYFLGDNDEFLSDENQGLVCAAVLKELYRAYPDIFKARLSEPLTVGPAAAAPRLPDATKAPEDGRDWPDGEVNMGPDARNDGMDRPWREDAGVPQPEPSAETQQKVQAVLDANASREKALKLKQLIESTPDILKVIDEERRRIRKLMTGHGYNITRNKKSILEIDFSEGTVFDNVNSVLYSFNPPETDELSQEEFFALKLERNNTGEPTMAGLFEKNGLGQAVKEGLLLERRILFYYNKNTGALTHRMSKIFNMDIPTVFIDFDDEGKCVTSGIGTIGIMGQSSIVERFLRDAYPETIELFELHYHPDENLTPSVTDLEYSAENDSLEVTVSPSGKAKIWFIEDEDKEAARSLKMSSKWQIFRNLVIRDILPNVIAQFMNSIVVDIKNSDTAPAAPVKESMREEALALYGREASVKAHVDRVERIVRLTGSLLKLTPEELELMKLGALLHDIGIQREPGDKELLSRIINFSKKKNIVYRPTWILDELEKRQVVVTEEIIKELPDHLFRCLKSQADYPFTDIPDEEMRRVLAIYLTHGAISWQRLQKEARNLKHIKIDPNLRYILTYHNMPNRLPADTPESPRVRLMTEILVAADCIESDNNEGRAVQYDRTIAGTLKDTLAHLCEMKENKVICERVFDAFSGLVLTGNEDLKSIILEARTKAGEPRVTDWHGEDKLFLALPAEKMMEEAIEWFRAGRWLGQEVQRDATRAGTEGGTQVNTRPGQPSAATRPTAVDKPGEIDLSPLAPRNDTQSEAERIHAENRDKYTAKISKIVPEKTILCHIVTDTILPLAQRPILQALRRGMEGDGFREKVVPLNVRDPADFVEELREVMADTRKKYAGYTVQFDVACPSTESANAVLDSNLGVKALAFTPGNEADIGIIQVEGIILALRALDLDVNADKIEALRAAFKFLMGRDLTREESEKIVTVDNFMRMVTFTLPVTKVDCNYINTLNQLISENIKTAA